MEIIIAISAFVLTCIIGIMCMRFLFEMDILEDSIIIILSMIIVGFGQFFLMSLYFKDEFIVVILIFLASELALFFLPNIPIIVDYVTDPDESISSVLGYMIAIPIAFIFRMFK